LAAVERERLAVEKERLELERQKVLMEKVKMTESDFAFCLIIIKTYLGLMTLS